MRSLASRTAAAAGTFAAIGIGTPVVATLVMPVLFPVVVAALAVYAWRADGR
jgi:hypothetical protein